MKYFALAALAVLMAAQPALACDKHMDGKTDAWFKKMDKDGDGKLTQGEHDAFGNKMFKEADANGDGSVTLEEMKAAHKDMKAKHDDHNHGKSGDHDDDHHKGDHDDDHGGSDKSGSD
ncbi:MAG TPA: EF-hand domain-containing protein [Patescibacteria group bacterium]|nr:EF-hand domain-containing protein [Patescibacteria group bacterium]